MDQEAVIEKPPLDHETLRDVIDLSLWAGQMLLQHGADTARVESVVHLIGTSLGAAWLDILVSPNALIVTTISGEEFRTKVRRVVTLGVNLSIVCAINDLAYRISWGQVDRVVRSRRAAAHQRHALELQSVGGRRHGGVGLCRP
ncbi:MAG: threonine/serine exporter family protein [Chloroflexi bacterium]|uniref:threonine/serine exporter family protein n=1 Tax=Candidatus Flexifilum breve TaxID=3140694 RepID=UPI0031359645|nr:threonine/serine exporter family protein [Chloroflexota bacterium]